MTLTQVAVWTRRGILTSVILIFLSISGIIGYNIWRQYYLAHLPPVEEKPEMKFGSISSPLFPPSAVSSSNFSYSLDTVTGGFPSMPKLIKVYFIPQAPISLMTTDRTKQLAKNLGFPKGPDILSPQEYLFTDDAGGNLRINIFTGNFHFQRAQPDNTSQNPDATGSAKLEENSLPDKDSLIQNFKNYLISKDLFPDEIKTGHTNVIFNGTSNINSNNASISIWPSNLNELPIITADLKSALIKGQVNKQSSNQFTKIDYIFWPIDKSTFSTYPIKTPEQALADLKSDQGFISLQPRIPQVSISSVYLAYYETETYSPYLQPVFVFEGPEFAAIVPAIAQ